MIIPPLISVHTIFVPPFPRSRNSIKKTPPNLDVLNPNVTSISPSFDKWVTFGLHISFSFFLHVSTRSHPNHPSYDRSADTSWIHIHLPMPRGADALPPPPESRPPRRHRHRPPRRRKPRRRQRRRRPRHGGEKPGRGSRGSWGSWEGDHHQNGQGDIEEYMKEYDNHLEKNLTTIKKHRDPSQKPPYKHIHTDHTAN